MAPQFKTAVTNVPTLTKTLLSTTLIITSMAYVYIYRQNLESDTPLTQSHCSLLGLVPGMIIYAPWTIVTSLFFENTLFTFISSMVILLLCGKYLERVWGSRELVQFILVTGIVSNIVTWFGLVLTFYMSGDDTYLYNIQINGMAGVFSGFLVAFKYLIPEHRISLLGGVLAIRVKNLLGLATVTSIVCLVLFKAVVFYNLVNVGWVVAWIYIRFLRVQDGIRGDRSEAFALVTFFPEFLRPVIGFLSNVVYQLFVKFNLCPPMSAHGSTMYDMENQPRHSLAPLPGSARAEAERRRALALKALDMRLSKPSTSGSAPVQTAPGSTNSAESTVSANTNINANALMEQQSASNKESNVLFDATSEVTKEV